uniref:Uncharacterized protein n=1 Tax=Anas platyrhynchos TaxID=8839 RepID=A0A8B9QPV4_ANAPL
MGLAKSQDHLYIIKYYVRLFISESIIMLPFVTSKHSSHKHLVTAMPLIGFVCILLRRQQMGTIRQMGKHKKTKDWAAQYGC